MRPKLFNQQVLLAYVSIFAIAILAFSPVSVSAQQLKMSDFILFGGFGTCPAGQNAPLAPGCAVQIGSNNTILNNGAIGSYSLIQSTGNATITGSLYSNGKIILSNNNSVTGRITAANKSNAGGTILQTGSGLIAGSTIDVHGNINIAGGTVSGKITQDSAKYTYTGPTPPGRTVAPLSLPTLPAVPEIKTFTVPTNAKDITTNNFRAAPGVIYKNVTFSGNKTLIFTDTGSYFFNSFTLSSNNTFVFDFNNHSGTIKIYVLGNMILDKIGVTIKGGGSEKKIFTETNGNTGAYAFTIANGSPSTPSRWAGTVWAPYSGINIGSGTGSSQLTGAFWSGTQVNTGSGVNLIYAPFDDCITPNVNAGVDKPLSLFDATTITGTSTTPSVSYNWTTANGGTISSPANAANITVTSSGSYILTVSTPKGCTASDTVFISSKVNNLIGSELLSLYQNYVPNTTSPFFPIQQDSVVIDIIVKEGKYDSALALLQTSTYGLTRIRSNGGSNFIITGLYPISKLPLLNNLTTLINFCRPQYIPVTGFGIANTQGDSAMRSNFIRNGYQLRGEGVRVGVLSDSYNTLPDNPAGTDIRNGDLPGSGNPLGNTDPVVVADFPYGVGVDEGRAMLQIIHDVAPKAKLEFKSGFISAGDMADKIRQLKQSNCDVIVDDITHITEPFLKNGVIAQAVNEVSAQGVSYFTAAGNYANKSYQSNYVAAPVPAGLTGTAHNFGSGDIFQHLSLKKGIYTIVLQWQDSIYSLGQTQNGGTLNDLDIYLTTNNGVSRYGYNRNNLGGDPIEILPFKIDEDVETDLFIVRAAGTSSNLLFKYIIFRGEGTITEHNNGTSTIVGQANADSAFTIAAVRYTRTPVFGEAVPLVESFSSYGTTTRNGSGAITRNKPDFSAPDGVNTSVSFGSPDIEGDQLPNFFGTSAAAPHAAATAALLIQARKKYYNEKLSVGSLRSILKTSALDMGIPGADSVTGAGFIRANVAIQSFAAALPSLITLVIPDDVTLGEEPFTLGIKGNYLSPTTQVYFNGVPVTTTFLTDSTASAQIPTFTGQPPIQAITASITPSGLDGGASNILYFNSIVKRQIVIKANDTTKRYGEDLPNFTSLITVDGIPLKNSGLTLADIGLDASTAIKLTTDATNASPVGRYSITPTIRTFDSTIATDSILMSKYDYVDSVLGFITVAKMQITVTPNNLNVKYGETIPDIDFKYDYNDSKISNKSAFLNSIKTLHQSEIVQKTFGLIQDRMLVNGDSLTAADIENLSFITSGKLIVRSGKLIIGSGKLIVRSGKLIIGSQAPLLDTTTVVEMPLASFFNFQANNITSLVNGKLIVKSSAVVNGQVFVNGKLIVRSSSSIINSENAGDQSDNNMAVYIDTLDLVETPGTEFTFKSLNLITGFNAGTHYIVPGAFVSENFEVIYRLGALNIAKATLTVKPDTGYIFKGDRLPDTLGYVYDGLLPEDIGNILKSPSYYLKDANGLIYLPGSIPPAGVYSSYATGLLFSDPNNNYLVSYAAGVFYVNPKGKDAKNVKPSLDCVDTLINDPSGYKYLARFSYENPNATVVYVPIGPNNSLTASGNYLGVQPEVFLPTGGKFTIKFNGSKMTWLLITYNGNQKSSSTSNASSTSNKCGSGGAARPITNITDARNVADKVMLYPNPVSSRLLVKFPKTVSEKNEVSISDVTGKIYKVKSQQKNPDGTIEFDMSNFAKGVYFIKINDDKKRGIFKIIKL